MEVNLDQQLDVAFKAFQNNGFILLINDEQVENLNERFLVEENTPVSFIKLTPLVGG